MEELMDFLIRQIKMSLYVSFCLLKFRSVVVMILQLKYGITDRTHIHQFNQ